MHSIINDIKHVINYDILAPILTKLYNVSIESKVVIPDWKTAKETAVKMMLGTTGYVVKIIEK